MVKTHHYQELSTLGDLRRKARLTQKQVAEFFHLKRGDTVGDWERGDSIPPEHRHRARFILYLLDKLNLHRDRQQFEQVWNDIMVETWKWEPLSRDELWHHLRDQAPAGSGVSGVHQTRKGSDRDDADLHSRDKGCEEIDSQGREMEGSLHIPRDAAGDKQAGNIHETHFYGPVTGPIHTGSGDIHVGSLHVGGTASSEAVLAELRQTVVDQAPQAVQSTALQRVDLLAEAIAEREPDLGLMESVLNWFQMHLPSLAGPVVTVILHPTVVQTIEAVGEPAVAEYHRRFGGLIE